MRRLIVIVAASALALAGCGGSDNETPASKATSTPTAATGGAASGGGGEVVKLAADKSALKFVPDQLEAKAGKVTLEMANPSDVPHAVEIEADGKEAKGETVTKGGTSKATLDLKPGTYEFYCPVDGHKAAGMVGKLTVK
jgi:plastocyanin